MDLLLEILIPKNVKSPANPFQTYEIHHRMAAFRVRRTVDNHRKLCRAGAGGTSAPRGQNGAGPEAGADRELLPVHLHGRGRAQNRRPRAGAAHRFLPAQHLEHDGFFCGVHGVRMCMFLVNVCVFRKQKSPINM